MARVLDGDQRLLRDWHGRNCASCVVKDCQLEAALLVAFMVKNDGIVEKKVHEKVWPEGWGKFGKKCNEFDPGF